jgi:deazaflavin-dependent oxidoreductase (nitroreductase family)
VPLPRWLARVNRRATNRVLGPPAARLPFFGVILHRGHSSGRLYRTPVNVFHANGGFIIALTYGRTDWLSNVLAAKGCELEHRGRRYRLTNPRVIGRAEAQRAIPSFVRFILDLIGVTEFVRMQPSDAA